MPPFIKQNYSKYLTMILTLLAMSGCHQDTDQQASVDQTTASGHSALNEDPQNNEAQQTDLSNDEIKAIESLLWIQKADLETDLSKAVNEKDFRLWVIATRGTAMPGIPLEKQASLSQSCGQKYLPGAGDTLINKNHRELYRQAFDYARQYNIKMQKYCEGID